MNGNRRTPTYTKCIFARVLYECALRTTPSTACSASFQEMNSWGRSPRTGRTWYVLALQCLSPTPLRVSAPLKEERKSRVLTDILCFFVPLSHRRKNTAVQLRPAVDQVFSLHPTDPADRPHEVGPDPALDGNGSRYISVPPPYACIVGEKAKILGVVNNLMSSFVDMSVRDDDGNKNDGGGGGQREGKYGEVVRLEEADVLFG